MRTYTFERTSEKDLYRVVHSRTRGWEWYWKGKLDQKKKLPKEDGIYLRAESAITDNGWPLPKRLVEWIRSLPKEESIRILQEAGERGTRVHRAIEMMFEQFPKSGTFTGIKVKKLFKSVFRREMKVWDDKKQEKVPLEDEDWECIKSFEHFWKLHNPFVFAVGSSLYSLQSEYAGTTDITGWILTQACGVKQCPCGKIVGKVGLPDLKTTRSIRDTHKLQVACFAAAENVGSYLQERKIEYTADLRLGTGHKNTKGYEFVVYDQEETAKNFEKFMHAKWIDENTRKPFDPEKEIQEVSDSVEIEIRPVPKIPKVEKQKKQAKKKWQTSKQKSKSSVSTAIKERKKPSVKNTLKNSGKKYMTKGSRQGKKQALKKARSRGI